MTHEHGPRCQQFELYAAERKVPQGHRFVSVESIQRWLDGLRDTWWWNLYYPQVRRVEVYSRPARMRDSVGSWHPELAAGKIEMLKVHYNELVLLHELAHVLAAARYDSHAHDPAFARVYLELVALVMGPVAYTRLYDSFEAAGIEHDVDEYRLGTARRMPAAEEAA